MIDWLLGRTRRGGSALAIVLACVATGCPVEQGAESGSTVALGVDGEAEPGRLDVLPGQEKPVDPEEQARIELLAEDARQSIRRASDFLAAQSRFRLNADIAFDVMQGDGRLLEFGGRREVTIRRPDRFVMHEHRRDGDERRVGFDGSSIWVDLPGHEAFVRIERPGTLYAALDHMVEDLGAPVPLANLLAEDFASELEGRIESGYFVGSEDVGGRSCEHLTFRLPDVDVQLWIEEGDRPLIARILIDYRLEPGAPQFRATLRDWDLEVDVPDGIFEFEPAEGSEQLVAGAARQRAGAGRGDEQ